MKRFNRFVPLDRVVERLVKEKKETPFRSALIKALPQKIFGPAIAAHIDDIQVEEEILRIRVSDPVWRVELAKNKPLLIRKARGHFSKIRVLEILP